MHIQLLAGINFLRWRIFKVGIWIGQRISMHIYEGVRCRIHLVYAGLVWESVLGFRELMTATFYSFSLLSFRPTWFFDTLTRRSDCCQELKHKRFSIVNLMELCTNKSSTPRSKSRSVFSLEYINQIGTLHCISSVLPRQIKRSNMNWTVFRHLWKLMYGENSC